MDDTNTTSIDIPVTRTYPVAQIQAPRFLRNDITRSLSGGDIAAARAIAQPLLAAGIIATAVGLGVYLVSERPIVSILAGLVAGVTAGVETFTYTCENKPKYR